MHLLTTLGSKYSKLGELPSSVNMKNAAPPHGTASCSLHQVLIRGMALYAINENSHMESEVLFLLDLLHLNAGQSDR